MIGAVSGPLSVPSGSAGAPSYAFTGAANTGMYNPAGSDLSLAAQGTSVLNITGSNGYVGIGTTSPVAPLEVKGKIAASGKVVVYNADATFTGSVFYGDGGTFQIKESFWDGTQNTSVGIGALYSNTTGSVNTANGSGALFLNTTGAGNTAIGAGALYSNTTGSDNAAIGVEALYSNTTGVANTANGSNALYSNTSGVFNTATGQAALGANTTGGGNTANGANALYSNTIGAGNSATGNSALSANTTGNSNTANGEGALYSNKTGNNNTANGASALFSNTTGSSNTANGYYAGYKIANNNLNKTSSNSVYIGANTKAKADGDSNEIVIGYNATGLGSNSVVLGSDSITLTALRGNVGIGTTAPTVALDVSGTGAQSAIILPRDTTDNRPTGINGMLRYNTSTNKFEAYENSAWTDLIGGVSASSLALNAGSAAAPSYAFSGATNTGMYNPSGSNLSLAAQGTAVFNITGSNGYVGIGTATPQAPLDVNGKIRAGGNTAIYNANNVVKGGGTLTGSFFVGDGGANVTKVNVAYTGTSNTGIGIGALYSLTGGFNNTAVGHNALYSATTGIGNVAMGRGALKTITTGQHNIGLGTDVLGKAGGGSSNNIAIGEQALSNSTGSVANIAIGAAAMLNSGSGINGLGVNNVAIGDQAFAENIDGYQNIVIGDQAGIYVSDGASPLTFPITSIYIGALTKAQSAEVYNEIVIGAEATGLGSNSVVLGNESITLTALRGKVGIGTTAPSVALDVYGSGSQSAIVIPRDTTAKRPTGVNGMLRYNTSTNKFEAYENSTWTNIIGGVSSSSLALNAGSAEAPSYAFSGANNTGMYNPTGSDLSLAVQGTAVLNITGSNGYVGIGTTSPGYKLHVLGAGGSTVAHFSDGAQTCSITPSTAGNISCSSDQRLKKDITPFDDVTSLENILQLNTVTYHWKTGDDKLHTGYIAQEVEKVAPEFVVTGKDGMKQVSYVGFIPWITGAIKAIYAKLLGHESEISAQGARIQTLESENAALKAEVKALKEQQAKELQAIKQKLGM